MSFPHRGDLYWVNLDPTIGSEIKKTRPCVVISPDAANQAGPLVIVAPISKAEGKKVFFHEVLLPKGVVAAIPFDSKIKVFQLRCVDKKRLGANRIGALPPNLIQDLNEKIRIVTGLY
ncbi:MAG: type II toxin-antitoxin system PemK/MazF family toxin [Candidatus Aminicenantia bacterium]